MNLIEQFGGYDVLNGFYKRSVAHGFTLTEIGEELLSYRREHGVFEVGDAMVIPSRGNGIFHFNAMFSDSDIVEARHATDAEIKAGKRLEVTK